MTREAMWCATKLLMWSIICSLIILFHIGLPRIRSDDLIWCYAAICAYPVGAFLSARGARSGIPFAVYGGAAALAVASLMQDHFLHLGVSVQHDTLIIAIRIATIGALMIAACRGAASLRFAGG